MGQTHIRRRITNVQFDRFSQRKTLRLPTDVGYKRLILEFSIDVTVAGGAASGAALTEAPYSFFTDIKVRLNSKQVLFAVEGGTHSRYNKYDYGTDGNPTSAIDGAEGTNDIATGRLILDFSYPTLRWKKLSDLYVPPSIIQTLELEVTIGTQFNLVTAANDRGWTLNDCNIEVYADVVEGLEAGEVKGLKKTFELVESISASSTRRIIELAAGNSYRRLLMKGELEVTEDESDFNPSSAVLNGCRILAGSLEVHNFLEVTQRGFETQRHGLETELAGYYMVDFSPDGLLTQVLGTAGLRTLDLECDVTAGATATQLRVVADEIVALPSV